VTPRQWVLLDRLVAAVLLLVIALHAVRIAHGVHPIQPEIDMVVVWSAAAISIAVRRRSAFLALAVMAAGVIFDVAWGPRGAPSSFPDVLIAVPMVQLASTTDRLPSLAGLGATLAALAGAAAAAGARGSSVGFAAAFVATAAWFVGDSVRVRRVYLAGLAEQGAQRQREALERAQRSLAEERLQIARELHDVVAHSLSVIAVQSGVGRHVIDTNPVAAKQALGAVEETSRAALDELRRMLGVLRGHDQEPAELAPAPGVASLGSLVEQVRTTGIPVVLEVTSSSARALSPAAELSVYRIVQEALTNVVKHAGPATAYVGLRDESAELVLEVRDDGCRAGGLPPYPGSVAPSWGQHGLVGMRERVALFGGSFAAGPQPQGGYRVVARFPIDRVSAA
jgi:signal transduction histidine kinase